MPEGHSTDNYFIGKGILIFKPEGETAFYDLGNVPEFEFTPTIEELPHYSSREGTRFKDKTVVIEKGGEIRVVMDELNARNLSLLLMGTIDDSDPLETVVNLFDTNAISGELRFYATNEVGPQWNYFFNKVDFLPSGTLAPISEEYGQLEVTGQLASTTLGFGTAVRKNIVYADQVPLNIVPPTISGTAQVGEVLTATEGTWLYKPTSLAYAWEADGTPIGGATASTFTPTVAEVGAVITVVVTATNANGSSTPAESAATAAVIAA